MLVEVNVRPRAVEQFAPAQAGAEGNQDEEIPANHAVCLGILNEIGSGLEDTLALGIAVDVDVVLGALEHPEPPERILIQLPTVNGCLEDTLDLGELLRYGRRTIAPIQALLPIVLTVLDGDALDVPVPDDRDEILHRGSVLAPGALSNLVTCSVQGILDEIPQADRLWCDNAHTKLSLLLGSLPFGLAAVGVSQRGSPSLTVFINVIEQKHESTAVTRRPRS
ncbi:MAG TPA: hypothetical protein PKH24_12565 [Sedimentisphaerales bacterium]|nr:hypothetical protein [Sedimentisphaerales bacterium]